MPYSPPDVVTLRPPTHGYCKAITPPPDRRLSMPPLPIPIPLGSTAYDPCTVWQIRGRDGLHLKLDLEPSEDCPTVTWGGIGPWPCWPSAVEEAAHTALQSALGTMRAWAMARPWGPAEGGARMRRPFPLGAAAARPDFRPGLVWFGYIHGPTLPVLPVPCPVLPYIHLTRLYLLLTLPVCLCPLVRIHARTEVCLLD